MNALSKLINRSIKKLNITKPELIKEIGFKNINKGMRRLNLLIETLDDKHELLAKIAKVLKVSEMDIQKAQAHSLQALVNDKNSKSKPRINLSFKPNLSRMTKWAVSSQLKQPNFNSQLTLEEELKEVCLIYQSHQVKFKRFTQGFCYVRKYSERYDFDENCQLIKAN